MINEELYYDGNDMGAVYAKDKTSFRVFAPTATSVELCLYESGDGDDLRSVRQMEKAKGGTWYTLEKGDLDKVYYTYKVTCDDKTIETGDPYAKTCGVNGIRSMVIDLAKTNPDGFEKENRPMVKSPVDAVVTEISVLDTTADPDCGVKNKSKFIGLTELGTKNSKGQSTGLSYIKELGVTHVQIMPSYDFGSIDESKPDMPQYNWGYDPINYNCPEGSFSTDPFHGEVRVKEMKEMIHAFHENGIGVIMDVVYNHTYDVDNNVFQKTAPDYYYRKDGDRYSDASACGNEVATERFMVRKFIVDSVCYWAKEYHIDGFRFDLMAVIDIETMDAIRAELDKINPDILVYGEGWAGDESVYPKEKRAFKTLISKIKNVAAFSDDIRDTVRGHVFYEKEKGFVNGKENMENDLKFSIVGATMHPEVNYTEYKYTTSGPWAASAADTVNYISCHDNLTLHDKLAVSTPGATEEELLAMNRLGAAIVMTSQGMPFFLMGEEFGRSKPIEGTNEYCENSFNVPIFTNMLRYDDAVKNKELLDYYKGLISIRKKYSAFKMIKAEEIRNNLKFLEVDDANVVAYTIETDKEVVFVAFNANKNPSLVQIPFDGEFQIIVDDDKAGTELICSIRKQALVKPVAALVAVMDKEEDQ